MNDNTEDKPLYCNGAFISASLLNHCAYLQNTDAKPYCTKYKTGLIADKQDKIDFIPIPGFECDCRVCEACETDINKMPKDDGWGKMNEPKKWRKGKEYRSLSSVIRKII